MAFELNIPLNDSDNVTFDADKVEITLTGTALKLNNLPNQSFVEDFEDDTGFVYDNTKVEFVGGILRQKDQRPANATLYIPYTNSLNGSWGNGVLTGAGFGGADYLNGELNLSFDDIRGVDYDAVANADSQQKGCIRVRMRPNYSGSPSTQQYISTICKENNSTINLVTFFHDTNGQMVVGVYDTVGAAIIYNSFGTWNPTINTIYEFELNFDVTFGQTRLFIDGQQLGITQTQTGVRDSDIGLLRIGSNYLKNATSNFKILDVIIFDAVQHTANYTPGETFEETIYLASTVILPEMEYLGVGFLQLFQFFLTTETGSPRFTLQIGRSGNYLYWSGAAWVVSDGTYTQATDSTTFNINAPTLLVLGEIYGQFKTNFDNSNTQSSIDSLEAILTGQTYLTTNPRVDINAPFNNEGILSFITTLIIAGLDNIKWLLFKGTTAYYWNGSAWVVSNETYNQSSTSAEVTEKILLFNPDNDNISTLISFFLHSHDGTTTPEAQNLFLTYDFFGGTVNLPNQCEVFGYVFNNDNEPVEDVKITIETMRDTAVYDTESVVCLSTKETYTDIDGYWDINLTETDNMPSVTYIFRFDCQNSTEYYKRKVPDVVSINFSELPEF